MNRVLKALAQRVVAGSVVGTGSYFVLNDVPEPYKTYLTVSIGVVAGMVNFGKDHLPEAVACAEKVREWVKRHPNAIPWLTRLVARFEPVEEK